MNGKVQSFPDLEAGIPIVILGDVETDAHE